MGRCRSGRGPALNCPRGRSQTKLAPLSLGFTTRANRRKTRSEEHREIGNAAVGGAKARIGVVRGGAVIDVTKMDEVEAGAVRDGAGGPLVGGA